MRPKLHRLDPSSRAVVTAAEHSPASQRRCGAVATDLQHASDRSTGSGIAGGTLRGAFSSSFLGSSQFRQSSLISSTSPHQGTMRRVPRKKHAELTQAVG
jgi:hypothetical protein